MIATLPTPAVRLDELSHRAFLGDRELIRATTALSECGIVDSRWFTPESCVRGQYLHEAIALWALGDLHEPSIDPAIGPYWVGFRRFLAESGFALHAAEQPVHDEIAGYAGRFDLFGHLPRVAGEALDLIDVKTGHAPTWVGLQTMLYRRCLKGAARVRRWALELPGDGTYRLQPLNLDKATRTIDRHIDRGDEHVALAAVAVARFKRGL